MFVQRPTLRTVRGTRLWQVVTPLIWDDHRRVTVPRGTRTDLASVPRPLWWLFPPSGSYTDAAVLHDYLYRTRQVSRHEADRVFRSAMQELGVARWRRALIWSGVRAFGWMAWQRKAQL